MHTALKTFLLLFFATLVVSDISAAEILKPSLDNQVLINKKILLQNIRNEKALAKRAENEAKNQFLKKVSSAVIVKTAISKNESLKNEESAPKKTIEKTEPKTSTPSSLSPESIAGVDMETVRSTWIGWYNARRSDAGLSDFSFDSRLDTTAQSWNQVFAAGKGKNHHERTPGDGYYNFAKISKWFADRGVVGVVKNSSTTVENVGYGYYSCSSSDCTDKLIDSIRSTFDFYMSEKKSNGPHYRSIMNPAFTKIGMSIRVEPSEKRYYLVLHYITEFK